MALKAIVENLDDVAEPLREYYQQREDGKYILAADDAEAAFASGVVKNRDEILNEKKELEKKLKQLETVDIDEYNRLKNAQEEAQRKKDEEAGNYRNLEKQLVERHTKEKEQLTGRIGLLEQALHKELIDARLTAEITAQKGVAALLLPVLRNSIKVVEDPSNGAFEPTVVDPVSGKARIGDTKGNPMTIAQLVTEAKTNETFGRAFEGSGAGGSGASQSNGGSNAGGIRLSREDAKDPAKYRAAREAAAAKGTTVTIME